MDIFIYFTKFTDPENLEHQCLSSRPVCSDCGSITNPIGIWVGVKLQPVAQSMKTYIKDSFEFKRLSQEHGSLNPRARMFAFDAMSMYTNIPIDYSWITCQLEVKTALSFLLSSSGFKSKTSFGFLSPNYTGHVTCFLTSKWPRLTSRRVADVFKVF